MSMQFTVNVSGTVKLRDLDASDAGIDADSVIENAVGYNPSLSFSYAEVYEATVTVEARAELTGIEVEAVDIEDFDAEQALTEGIDVYNVSVNNADFDIEESPTGFEEVEQRLGRSTAIEVYGILASNGYEVVV